MSSAAQKLQLNPVSPENLLDPTPLYQVLRHNVPVYWSDAVNAWFLTRYDDVVASFRDPRLSADRVGFFEAQLQGLNLEAIRKFVDTFRRQMVQKDGMEHLRQRRQVSPSFSPQALDVWRPIIRRIADSLVDRVQDWRRMELVREIAYPLPQLVIAELLGIPAEDRERFCGWSKPIAEFSAPTANSDRLEVARRANTAVEEFSEYLTRVIAERRQAPGRDVLSRMIQAGGMSDEELVANAILMLFAGHTTTTDQISNLFHELLMHPEQFQKLREDRGLIPSAVEESIRFRPAVPSILRIAKETFQLRGRTIRKGDMVFLMLGAANRDPEVFPDAERFDITRDHVHQKHVSFGFGAHHCLGSGVARRELEIILEVMLDRMPGLRLEEGHLPEHKCHHLTFRGFDSLRVRW
ncbi:cytochrome P450 [Archangium gephyra]|uniref:cytochrome P450 n=1 Tax=Archangium gephyra TaxID=48 RepID=UPI003B813A8E